MGRYSTDCRTQYNRDPRTIYTWDARKIKRRKAAKRKLYILGAIIGLGVFILLLITLL